MGGLFSRPKAPEVKAPEPIPDPDDESIAIARARELRRQRNRRGRASTQLTEQPGGGGAEFSRTLLG